MGEKGMWPRIEAIEIGNEIDTYAKNHPRYRGNAYVYDKYVPEHAAYIAKLRAVGMPAHKVQGAVYESYSTTFQKDVGLYLTRFAAELRSFCYHVYAVGGCNKGATATVAELLSDERWLPNGTLRLAPYIAMAGAKGVPFVVGESNSVSCGGGAGVSNTFASSLWVPHFLAELSKGGVERVNIHGGPLEIYAPIRFKEGTLLVEPLYYGMLAFAELTANHSRWLAHTQSAAAPEFVAHATVNVNGDVKVLLIAKDLADAETGPRSVSVCLDATEPNQIGNVAKVFSLTAPSVNSTGINKVIYAGQTFQGSHDGRPIGDRAHVSIAGEVRDGQMCFNCRLSPLSAALVVVEVSPLKR
jgi:hypothetical protein